MSGAVLLLLFVTVQRGAELLLSRRNTARLMEAGAHEAGASHYPLMVGFHAVWLAGLWLLAPGREVNPLWFVAFLILQLGRLWVIATLGKRWTTRIIIRPGVRLIRRGPYRLRAASQLLGGGGRDSRAAAGFWLALVRARLLGGAYGRAVGADPGREPGARLLSRSPSRPGDANGAGRAQPSVRPPVSALVRPPAAWSRGQ